MPLSSLSLSDLIKKKQLIAVYEKPTLYIFTDQKIQYYSIFSKLTCRFQAILIKTLPVFLTDINKLILQVFGKYKHFLKSETMSGLILPKL